jgi:hypothetical protein
MLSPILGTQNPVGLTPSVGSTPTSGTNLMDLVTLSMAHGLIAADPQR